MIRQAQQSTVRTVRRVRLGIARVAIALALCVAGLGPLQLTVHAFGADGHFGWLAQTAASGEFMEPAPHSRGADADDGACEVCEQLGIQRAGLASVSVEISDLPLVLRADREPAARASASAPLRLHPARGPPASA